MADIPDMYEQAYWDIQKILDEWLGPDVRDGVGEGIRSDVRAALAAAEARGRKQAAHDIADRIQKIISNLEDSLERMRDQGIYEAAAERFLELKATDSCLQIARAYAAGQDTG